MYANWPLGERTFIHGSGAERSHNYTTNLPITLMSFPVTHFYLLVPQFYGVFTVTVVKWGWKWEGHCGPVSAGGQRGCGQPERWELACWTDGHCTKLKATLWVATVTLSGAQVGRWFYWLTSCQTLCISCEFQRLLVISSKQWQFHL